MEVYTSSKSNPMVDKYFLMPPVYPEEWPIFPGIRSLYHLAKLAKKQALYVNIPPTILLGFNHDNMFLYTKESTRCLSVISDEMSPKLIMHYIKAYMGRGEEEEHKNQNSRIKSTVYPKYEFQFQIHLWQIHSELI